MGGMQRHSLNLVKYLVLNNQDVTLMHCVHYGDKIPTDKEVSLALFGVEKHSNFKTRIVEFPKPGTIPGHYIRNSYKFSKQVYEVIKEEINDYNFIYVQGFSAWHLLTLKNIKRPMVGINFHGCEMFQSFPDFKTRLKNQLLIQPVRKNLRMADIVFSLGGKIDEIVFEQGVPKNKILSIHGALDDMWFESNEPKEVKPSKKLLFVGRFERRKGVEELNEVLPELLDKYDFTFDFVGPIPEENRIKHPKVTYLGELKSVDQIKDVYQNHDILIAPSYSEGMPNVIMEAMSQGLAILATDVGATSILVNQENGWLMPEMSKKILNEFMVNILSSESKDILAKKFSSQERLDSKFSWKQIALKHIEEIRKVIELS
jgi:glycosyltransferase involved in cell wall biosynthesis